MILYVKTGCPWCIEAQQYLRDKGYQFTEIDVVRDREAFDEMKSLSGQTYAPTLKVGEHVLADFDTAQLERFLTQHSIRP